MPKINDGRKKFIAFILIIFLSFLCICSHSDHSCSLHHRRCGRTYGFICITQAGAGAVCPYIYSCLSLPQPYIRRLPVPHQTAHTEEHKRQSHRQGTEKKQDHIQTETGICNHHKCHPVSALSCCSAIVPVFLHQYRHQGDRNSCICQAGR